MEIEALTSKNRAIVHQVYDLFKKGDMDGVGRLLADDIDWHMEGPTDVFSFCGERKGRAAVVSMLRALVAEYVHLKHEPQFIIVDGAHACLFASARLRHRASGQEVAADICDLMEIADGKIVWFRELFDSHAAAEMITRTMGSQDSSKAGSESGR